MNAILVATAALGVSVTAAFGQGLPNVPSMSCRQANDLVRSRGQIVLRTSPTTYDRFVSLDSYCQPDATAFPAFEPTRDNKQCMIGYYCKPKEENAR